MNPLSRRGVLAATAAGGALTARVALAQGNHQNGVPQPIKGHRGGTDPGPRNLTLDRLSPDMLAPPATDVGDVPNLKWPFAFSHNRLTEGGWARQTTIRELPVSKEIAGVDMRLNPGAIRELHWHTEDEWSLMLDGSARVTCVDENGRNFINDVQKGDLWYFRSGLPHSIQALEQGCEFLLVFDSGSFSEDNTFLLSQWTAHVPPEVLAKNFGDPESAFANIPKKQLYIFNAQVPPPLAQDMVADPGGGVPEAFTFKMMDMTPIECPGGTVRIVDSHVFKASRNIAAAFVEINPGGMRELHWHPLADEWQYYISGQARMTVFASGNNSRTFDFQEGDVGYVPRPMGHYIENTGSEPVRYLEMFKAPRYTDVSLQQWLAVIPPELVQNHLHLSQTALTNLPKRKPFVVAGNAQGTRAGGGKPG
jgi:oxalate decarboxylase